MHGWFHREWRSGMQAIYAWINEQTNKWVWDVVVLVQACILHQCCTRVWKLRLCRWWSIKLREGNMEIDDGFHLFALEASNYPLIAYAAVRCCPERHRARKKKCRFSLFWFILICSLDTHTCSGASFVMLLESSAGWMRPPAWYLTGKNDTCCVPPVCTTSGKLAVITRASGVDSDRQGFESTVK